MATALRTKDKPAAKSSAAFSLTLQRDEFVDALRRVKPAIDTTISAAAKGAVLEAGVDGPALWAGGGISWKRCELPSSSANLPAGVRLLVQPKVLLDMLREELARQVQLKCEGSKLVLSCGLLKLTLPAIAVDEEVQWPQLELKPLPVDSAEFQRALDRVSGFAATPGKGAYMNHYTSELWLLHEPEGRLRILGTDGHHLALDAIKAPKRCPLLAQPFQLDKKVNVKGQKETSVREPGQLLIGVKEAREVVKLRSTAPLTVCRTDKALWLASADGSELVCCTLGDCRWPDYKRVISERAEGACRVSAAALLKVLRRSADFSSTVDRNPICRAKFDEGVVRFITDIGEAGELSERAACDWTGPPAAQIAFNPGLLEDCVRAVSRAEVVTLSFRDSDPQKFPSTPFQVSADSDPGFCAVLMPIRLD